MLERRTLRMSLKMRLQFWRPLDFDEDQTCYLGALLVYFLFHMHFVISICFLYFSKFWQLSSSNFGVNVF